MAKLWNLPDARARGASAFPRADTRHKHHKPSDPASAPIPILPSSQLRGPSLPMSRHSAASGNVMLRPTCFCTVTVASPGFGAADGDARRMRHEPTSSSGAAARGRGRQRQRHAYDVCCCPRHAPHVRAPGRPRLLVLPSAPLHSANAPTGKRGGKTRYGLNCRAVVGGSGLELCCLCWCVLCLLASVQPLVCCGLFFLS